MSQDTPPTHQHVLREAWSSLLLLGSALVVLCLVLLAGTVSRQAQEAQRGRADALAADRALLAARLAALEGSVDDGRVARALDEARRLLEKDAVALAMLDRIATRGATPPGQDAASLAAFAELRTRLAVASRTAADAANREESRARSVTLAAAALFIALTIGTLLMIIGEMRRRRRLAQTLERQANHDPLTMLPNRRFFLEWLGYALAQSRRDGSQIGLLYIDLDGFKLVNDRHGHRRGDAVLAAIGERLRDTKREGDVLARLGGDEFALAAPNARDGRELASLGERLLAALSGPAQPRLADVPVGASIGIAFFPDDAGDVPGLIAAADAAMYAAKREGGNRLAFHATSAALQT